MIIFTICSFYPNKFKLHLHISCIFSCKFWKFPWNFPVKSTTALQRWCSRKKTKPHCLIAQNVIVVYIQGVDTGLLMASVCPCKDNQMTWFQEATWPQLPRHCSDIKENIHVNLLKDLTPGNMNPDTSMLVYFTLSAYLYVGSNPNSILCVVADHSYHSLFSNFFW